MTLEDRRIQFNALSAKNTLLETDLTLSAQQYQDALNNIKRLKIDNQQLLDKLEHEHRKEKDVRLPKMAKRIVESKFVLFLGFVKSPRKTSTTTERKYRRMSSLEKQTRRFATKKRKSQRDDRRTSSKCKTEK